MMGTTIPNDTMDRIECSAIYIDHRVRSERWVDHNTLDPVTDPDAQALLLEEPESLRSDVRVLLGVCKRIYLCQAGASIATKLAELSDGAGSKYMPIFAFFDIDLHGEEPTLHRRRASRGSWADVSPPSPASLRRGFTFSSNWEGAYDLKLLSGLSTDIQVQDLPNLIVPVAILRPPSGDLTSAPIDQAPSISTLPDPQHISKCLDAGAVDVLVTPLDSCRAQALVVHAYRTRKTALRESARFLSRKKTRKHSWVGVHDEQPYAYLREAMVSKLMKGICNPEEVIEEFQDRELDVRAERAELVREQIGQWSFTAHGFSDDELVLAAFEMLQHALSVPDLGEWQLTPGELRTFLLACRASYNSFVLYHNFRHAIDVLQSVFCFLLHIGALPPYRSVGPASGDKCPIASLLTPFDTLTLLISAIGHDVGHPGVNNFFLVKLNAPLAQLYNDNSVLEAFHCAAFSQILRRYWPAAFKDRQLRKLLISSILATDMGVHQKFMERLGSLQERFHENDCTTDGWKPQDLELYKTLVCGLLIKCADISNVARPWDVAEKWTQILQEEFANQGEMEKEVGMETALFGGPPELGNIYKLATGQIGFMSIFALPLFEGVSDILPDLKFTVDHIRGNQFRWHMLADREKSRQTLLLDLRPDEVVSPRTQSPIRSLKGMRAPVATPGPDTLVKPAFPTSEHTPRSAPDDYFGAVHSPVNSDEPPSDYNENNISPVVSPDTPGPSMDITGSPFPTEIDSRKSSGAVFDHATVSTPGESRTSSHDFSTTPSARPSETFDGASDTNRSSTDPTMMATVVLANSSATNGGASGPSSARNSSIEGVAERPSSSRQAPTGCRRRHANTGSSGRTSGLSSSQRNSCTRTHSVSTYSNNMTPISPATNATSFLTVDSDEKGFTRESVSRSDNEEWSRANIRPATSNHESTGTVYPVNRRASDPHTYDAGGKHLGSPAGNGTGSSGQSTTTAGSSKQDGRGRPWGEPGERHSGPFKLVKRRSRLRLAFWRRKPHHSHQHELSGET
ncbi:3',5'-cyclic-nucleotide phosphodiesterase PDE2 [Aspergillus aculeatinus CBS 121060]|uniref:High affinity cAMP phosphodiesterase n=1 Tax=Aspergillus aculeatinus CBS 121060 TaxID=1448322 RepID=A0ACD1HBE3_9EURO|nr:high affinity cAMP phosphodiesterase [Aspergillus aculeatinus CBS 121060]RAH70719.1 high affinity cAMP phosphodiesterase [Aspergillus aculeatinus CBS 121060]